MFYGHIGVALAAKPLAPKTPVGVLLISATLADILCGLFIAFRLEGEIRAGVSSIPWSHGLFMSVVWAILVLGLSWIITKNIRVSLVIAGLVFSHWVLDFISHPMGLGKPVPPDLPLLFNNSPRVGLGLYNSMVAALVTEFGLLIGGSLIYLMKTKAIDRTGRWAFGVFVLFIALFPLTALLPAKLLYLSTLVCLFLLPIGIWIDRHRRYVN